MFVTFLVHMVGDWSTFRELKDIFILLEMESLQSLLLIGLCVLRLGRRALCSLERSPMSCDQVLPQIPFVLHHLEIKDEEENGE